MISVVRAHRRSGFTLIEMIVVLMIVAATAGLVIPAVAMLGRSSDMAVSGHTSASLAGNIQEFFLLQKRYPQGVDSLLVDGGHGVDATLGSSDGTPDSLYTAVTHPSTSEQVSGMTTSNPALVNILALGTLTSNQRRSFTRGGFDYVFDHQGMTVASASPFATAGELNANNSGKFRRTLPSSGTMPAAVISTTLTQNMAETSGGFIALRGLVPAEVVYDGTAWDYVPELGTQLVAVGIGPNCRLFGTTAVSCPLYPGNDGKYYGRYIAVFKVFETGERPVLVGLLDPYGRPVDYSQQQFNESLPNGGRQG